MLADINNQTVPLSRLLAVGQRDACSINRDNSGTHCGMASLKTLANKILLRDTARDDGELILEKSVPVHKKTAGQRDATDWLEYFDERAGVAEYEGRMTREKSVRMAYEACVIRWLNNNTPLQSTAAICPHCNLPNGAIGTSCIPVLNGTGHLWLHHKCLEPWLVRRRQEAIVELGNLGIKP